MIIWGKMIYFTEIRNVDFMCVINEFSWAQFGRVSEKTNESKDETVSEQFKNFQMQPHMH